MSGTTYDAGDIVLIPFPFTDLTAVKRRPVLVLSTRECNRESDDFVVCGITSNLRDRAHSILLEPRDMAEGDLPVTSRVKVDKIFTLEQDLALRRLGRVRREVLQAVRRELAAVLGV